MISRHTSSDSKQDGFPGLHYHNLRCAQTWRQHCQALPGISPAYWHTLRVYNRPHLSLQSCSQYSHVDLEATTSVQSTLQVTHPWILVRQLPYIPQGSQLQPFILPTEVSMKDSISFDLCRIYLYNGCLRYIVIQKVSCTLEYTAF